MSSITYMFARTLSAVAVGGGSHQPTAEPRVERLLFLRLLRPDFVGVRNDKLVFKISSYIVT